MHANWRSIVATLTIRDLDDSLKLKLRLQAASRNHSMEEEARQILRAALQEPVQDSGAFVSRIRARLAGLGDVRLPIEPREAIRAPLEIHEAAGSYVVPEPRAGRAKATRGMPKPPPKARKP